MTDYVKATNYRIKDTLTTGDPNKTIKGSEIDDEFNNLQIAINSKSNITSPTFSGTPTAPTANIGNNSTQIATTAFVFSNSVPIGGIIMWSGSVLAIPLGYSICDGTSGTPNLLGKFLIGAGGVYSVGASGGSANSIVPSHTHTTTVIDPGHTHYVVSGQANEGNGAFADSAPRNNKNTSSSVTGIAVVVNTIGVSPINTNLPPYYALAYIMRVS